MADSKSDCIFCTIITNNENIIEQEDDLVILKDIKPAAKCHFLIISRRHIVDAKCLTKSDEPLLKRMTEKAKQILEKNNADTTDSRIVFHWPPFHSVSHLHLHSISPASEMSLLSKLIFKQNSWWCATPEYALQRITK